MYRPISSSPLEGHRHNRLCVSPRLQYTLRGFVVDINTHGLLTELWLVGAMLDRTALTSWTEERTEQTRSSARLRFFQPIKSNLRVRDTVTAAVTRIEDSFRISVPRDFRKTQSSRRTQARREALAISITHTNCDYLASAKRTPWALQGQKAPIAMC